MYVDDVVIHGKFYVLTINYTKLKVIYSFEFNQSPCHWNQTTDDIAVAVESSMLNHQNM